MKILEIIFKVVLIELPSCPPDNLLTVTCDLCVLKQLFACFEICVETNRPTNPDTEFKMVRGQMIEIILSSNISFFFVTCPIVFGWT